MNGGTADPDSEATTLLPDSTLELGGNGASGGHGEPRHDAPSAEAARSPEPPAELPLEPPAEPLLEPPVEAQAQAGPEAGSEPGFEPVDPVDAAERGPSDRDGETAELTSSTPEGLAAVTDEPPSDPAGEADGEADGIPRTDASPGSVNAAQPATRGTPTPIPTPTTPPVQAGDGEPAVGAGPTAEATAGPIAEAATDALPATEAGPAPPPPSVSAPDVLPRPEGTGPETTGPETSSAETSSAETIGPENVAENVGDDSITTAVIPVIPADPQAPQAPAPAASQLAGYPGAHRVSHLRTQSWIPPGAHPLNPGAQPGYPGTAGSPGAYPGYPGGPGDYPGVQPGYPVSPAGYLPHGQAAYSGTQTQSAGYFPTPAAAPSSAGVDVEATAEIPRIRGAAPDTPSDWDMTGPAPGTAPPAGGGTRSARRLPRLNKRISLVVVAVLGLLILGYVADVVSSRGQIPRGVTVAGVSIGGLDRASAEQLLRSELEPRLTRPLQLVAGDVEVPLNPTDAGLALDRLATLDEAGEQPLNPWTRLVSLFTTREVGVATTGDRDTVLGVLEGLRPEIDRESVEGTIRFEGAQPIPVDPIPGQRLDLPAAADVLLQEWVRGETVRLPVETTEVTTTPEGIRAALSSFVEPAVSGPVTITGEGTDALLEPREIAEVLRFAPDESGGLKVTVDDAAVIEILRPKLAGTEQDAKDATIALENGRPVVTPSEDGRSIDWEQSVLPLPDVLRASGPERTMPAVYNTEVPSLSTEQANQLGITTQISSFTTGGFAPDSGHNIRRAAEQVNGAIVRPGETFSLNGHTGPRNAASGYRDAGIIQNGRPGRGIGGGVSQFATTLFNASYFAGMVDVEHREHSYYISRYPAGREATVYEGAIDVKFRNDSPTGVLIQTSWTPSSVTVTFWGTKHVEVESITGERTNFTEPPTRHLSGPDCISTSGSQGFTVTDTRVVRDANTGAELSRNTRTVVYNPQPRIICE